MQLNDIILALIGILGTGGIWKYLEFRKQTSLEREKYQTSTSTDVIYRDDLKQRVQKLESLLEESSKEKDEMRMRIEQLIAEVNALRVEVEYLKKENDRLKDRR